MNYIELGSAPVEENCVQVRTGEPYLERMLAECRRYMRGLAKRFPNNRFAIKQYPHDFGTYAEVVVRIEDESAFEVEKNLPATWAELEGEISPGLYQKRICAQNWISKMRELHIVLEEMFKYIVPSSRLKELYTEALYMPPEFYPCGYREVAIELGEMFPDPLALTDNELEAIRIFMDDSKLTREQLIR